MLCFVDEVFETNTVPLGHREREICSVTTASGLLRPGKAEVRRDLQ